MTRNKPRLLFIFLFIFISYGVSAGEPAWILLEKGKAAFEKRNITESLDLLLQAVEQNTDYPEAEYWLGRVYEAQGQAVLAEEQYRRAIHLAIYLMVPEDVITYKYTLAELLLNQGVEREGEALSIFYGIADEEGASDPGVLSLEHSYIEQITENGIDDLLYLYRDELRSSLKARRILGELSWENGKYRSSLLYSTRVVLSLMTTAAEQYRFMHSDWRFDIDEKNDQLNPDRDVRYPGASDGASDMIDRIYSSDKKLSDWLESEGFWPQLYLLSISLFAEGFRDSAESLWEMMVVRDETRGTVNPRPEAGKWGILAEKQLEEPFISNGSISP
jgi:tetratricopeptide (TPR) repeat protein